METCRFSVNNKNDSAYTEGKGWSLASTELCSENKMNYTAATIQFSLACTKHHPKSWSTMSSWEPLSYIKEKRGTARRLWWLWSLKRQQREHIILHAVFFWIQNIMVSLSPASPLWWWAVWRGAKVFHSWNSHGMRNLSLDSKDIIRVLSPVAIGWHMAAPLPPTSITLRLKKKKKKRKKLV